MGKHNWVIALALITFLALMPLVAAGSMKLLAVSKTKTGLVGTDADLELTIKPGRGRVFISTSPLTNVDTQISFRMAKEFACDFLDRDCSSSDFFYVVRSNAPIIGGPSAGGAATALTIAELDRLTVDPKAAATGTINSGGIIGPVAGIKQKIDAAGSIGLTKVLIPEGTRYYSPSDDDPQANSSLLRANETKIDLIQYGMEKGITVVEVAEIGDMIYGLTGKRYPKYDENVEIDPAYAKLMQNISNDLCRRSAELLSSLRPGTITRFNDTIAISKNMTDSGAQAYSAGLYYSAASFCYGANVKYRYLSLVQQNLSTGELSSSINTTRLAVRALEDKLNGYTYDTITDMQTYLVVNERVEEAKVYLSDATDSLNSSRDNAEYGLALAMERQYSAFYWSKFFGLPGKKFNIQKDTLSQFCLDRVSEADERLQYIKSIVMIDLGNLQDELDTANSDYLNGSYEKCIFTASKVKARSNLLLSALWLQDKDFGRVIDHKIDITKQVIIKETKRNVFPLLGYSYYEYARSLKGSDPSSALLYAELALELSNFDMYFKPGASAQANYVELPNYMYFLGGMISGYTIAIIIIWIIKLFNRSRKGKTPLKAFPDAKDPMFVPSGRRKGR